MEGICIGMSTYIPKEPPNDKINLCGGCVEIYYTGELISMCVLQRRQSRQIDAALAAGVFNQQQPCLHFVWQYRPIAVAHY